MRIIPADWIATIKGYDPSIDVLWNDRKNVWVVVQDVVMCGGGWRRLSSDLMGCSAITGSKTRYKSLFQCKTKDGYRFDPTPWWVIRLLEELYPRGEKIQKPGYLEESEKAEQEAWAKDDADFRHEVETGIARHLTTKTVDLGAT